jgi:hypothetical protein
LIGFISSVFINENNGNVVLLNIENSNTGQIILETNINRNNAGGLYAELVYNRAFQG